MGHNSWHAIFEKWLAKGIMKWQKVMMLKQAIC